MKTRLSVLSLALAFAASIAFTSCASPGIPLKHRDINPAAADKGSLTVMVTNARPEKSGGSNAKLLGNTRNGYGMPLATSAADAIDAAFASAIEGAAQEAGFTTVGSGAPTLKADIKTFWIDGYAGVYVIKVELLLKLNSFEKTISFDHAAPIIWSSAELIGHYAKFMNKLIDEVESVLTSSDFKAAL